VSVCRPAKLTFEGWHDMKSELFSGAAKALLPLLCIMNLFLLIRPMQALGEAPGMQNYCNVPPLPGSGVKPNLLLMIDNSASMYDPAYTDPANYCLDDSYDDASHYPGYFDQGSFYSYTFKTVTVSNKNEDGYFVLAPAGQTIASSSCNTAKTDFVCVNILSGKVDGFLASGKFLNWLAMSKLDLEKLALTGGKMDTSGRLQSETRGCQGRRFIRMIPGLPVTFAVRGPLPLRSSSTVPTLPAESDYMYRAGYGGMTRIEIYAAPYKKEACLGAVQAWQEGTLATLKAAALNCMNTQYDDPPVNKIPSRGKVFTEIMSDCYTYLVKRETLSTVDETLVADCAARIKNRYLDNAAKIPPSNGDDVCGKGLYHPISSNSSSTGYLGQCYASPAFDLACVLRQTKDYCDGLANPSLTDPSVTAYKAGTSANVPGFILDGGISNLGDASGTMIARFIPASPQPKGVIQEFGSEINFGAMVFKDNGAGSECSNTTDSTIHCVKHCQLDAVKKECYQDTDCSNKSPGSCQEDPHTDGGKVISYLSRDPIGSHNASGAPGSGLIAAIDQITATSWTPLSESFRDAMRHFTDDTGLELQPGCQRNNILIVTDGISTADRAQAVNDFVAQALGQDGMPASKTTPNDNSGAVDPLPFQGSYNLDDLAWIARHKKISGSGEILSSKDYLSTYVIYTGAPCGDRSTEPPTGYKADGSCTTSDEGVPEKMMQLVASKGGGTIASAQKPGELEKAMRWMLQKIATGSGAEPSILSTGDGNGALFMQEQFHQIKSFDGGTTSASWIGEMQSLWYYIDPFIGSLAGAGSAIREDTVDEQRLDLKNDKIVNLRFDAASNRTYAYLMGDSNGDGIGDGVESKIEVDQLKSLWRAGRKLWERDLTLAPRSIYTPVLPGGTQLNGSGLMKFSWSSSEAIKPYLNLKSGDPDAAKIIKYLHGFDFPDDSAMRSRTVTIGGIPEKGSDPQEKGVGVWKLGDIISSTPQVQSSVSLASYNLSAPGGYNDGSYRRFIDSDGYKSRGMVYVGANDGMLHAFKLGQLNAGDSEALKATLTGSELGKEQWAFIPKNALPYLKYLADPKYPHLYYVDGKITLVDASIGDFNSGSCSRATYWYCPKTTFLPDSSDPDPARNTWRTVLIGAMGLGGASSCGTGEVDCVPTPLADPADSGKGLGHSSYFALDVTDPDNPSLLWEFSDPDLGYSTTGPAIVRIGERGPNGVGLNGRWFAVFGSGPAGPIDSSSRQFLGRSNRDLKFFIVDLRSGTLVRTITTDIDHAFAGSMIGGAIDADKWKPSHEGNYHDDAIYIGYTRKSPATGAWTDGGVVRIITRESLQPDGSNPWTWSKVIDGVGPVTTGIARLQDRRNHKLWLYFGSGRYFFTQDDMQPPRALYGVKEPCYNYNPLGVDLKADKIEPRDCSASVGVENLVDQSTTLHQINQSNAGWRINLDPASGGIGAERVVTNPASITGGAVFFSTFQPNTEPCQLDQSYLWGVKYDTGGAIADGTLQGKVLVRLATGSLQDTGLSGKLTQKGGRRSADPMSGKAGGMKIVSNSGLRPLKKIIHIQER